MSGLVIIGCGFVADLYMTSLAVMPSLRVIGAHDRDPARQAAFCAHWGVTPVASLEAAIAATPRDGVLLNLTNPSQHQAVAAQALSAGRHVWCEKPMTLDLASTRAMLDLATANGVQCASAPSSVLGQAAQLWIAAARDGTAGTPRLVYAELDDGFIPQAPTDGWRSVSGAPWPAADEYATGCTLEHAGYYLSWLIAAFGPVTRMVAASAQTLPGKPGAGATPDFATATLFFNDTVTARLTCSIAAPHDHRIRLIGDAGVLEVSEAWNNAAPVRFRRRMVIRRRLLESPLARTIKARGPTHPMVKRTGAAAMNFALGPAEMLDAIAAGRPSRLSGAYALHLTEATLAMQAGHVGPLTTTCDMMEPMPWAR
jgi:predicted dehydrogenase